MKTTFMALAISLCMTAAYASDIKENTCMDMEHYDDVLEYDSTITVFGYLEKYEAMSKPGEPAIIEVIGDGKNLYLVDFNYVKREACFTIPPARPIEVKSYETHNPWVE